MTPHDVPTLLGRVRVFVGGPERPFPASATPETIVMWPSLLMDGTLWKHQVAHFKRDYRVVTVDPPGQGESQDLDRDFTIDDCVLVLEAILDALGVERAHLLGSSWGAMVDGAFAASHPDRVGRCVLMNGTASVAPRAQQRQYAALLVSARLLGGIRWPLTRSVVKAFLGRTTRSRRPEVVALVAAAARRNSVRSVSHAVRSVVPRRPDHLELFAKIVTPVLIVAGFEDRTFPLVEVQQMAGAIPGSQLVVLSDAAHLVAVEVPDQVNAVVEEFLAG